MGTQNDELDGLFNETRELYAAARNSDIEAIGRLLDARGDRLARIKAAGGFGKDRTPAQQKRIAEILMMDRKANAQLAVLLKDYGKEYNDFSKKAKGLMQYSSGQYNLASGQLFDRRDS